MKIQSYLIRLVHLMMTVCLFGLTLTAQADDLSGLRNQIENIRFSSLPGGKLAITLTTTQPLANPPAGFMLKQPPRIALDFLNTGSSLAANKITVNQGALKSIAIAQAKSRTRMVLNLRNSTHYSTKVNKNTVTILLENKKQHAASTLPTQFAKPILTSRKLTNITNINFSRGRQGKGKVIVDLSDTGAVININQKNEKFMLIWSTLILPKHLSAA